jgi:hypothetical protein
MRLGSSTAVAKEVKPVRVPGWLSWGAVGILVDPHWWRPARPSTPVVPDLLGNGSRPIDNLALPLAHSLQPFATLGLGRSYAASSRSHLTACGRGNLAR